MNAIEVFELSRSYGRHITVNRISFHVSPGEIFGFLGPNGTGKTTTIKLLSGQLRPSGGAARVAGWNIVTERKRMQPCIGVVFEYQNIYPRLSARDNLAFTAGLYGAGKERIDIVLAQVGLTDRADDRAKDYSNGMKQRLLIARALLHEPQVLFLDEPTRGLAPGVSRAIRKIIRDLANGGVSIFLTTHYMEETDQLCNRVAVLENGEIAACDTPAALKERFGGSNMALEDAFIELTGAGLHNRRTRS